MSATLLPAALLYLTYLLLLQHTMILCNLANWPELA